ncbi:hypothetical protein PLESTM_001549000 [Pleodorina starrii]|nr:hypothetical protein PLESTM_001549000 [Pleodorina starrii]
MQGPSANDPAFTSILEIFDVDSYEAHKRGAARRAEEWNHAKLQAELEREEQERQRQANVQDREAAEREAQRREWAKRKEPLQTRLEKAWDDADGPADSRSSTVSSHMGMWQAFRATARSLESLQQEEERLANRVMREAGQAKLMALQAAVNAIEYGTSEEEQAALLALAVQRTQQPTTSEPFTRQAARPPIGGVRPREHESPAGARNAIRRRTGQDDGSTQEVDMSDMEEGEILQDTGNGDGDGAAEASPTAHRKAPSGDPDTPSRRTYAEALAAEAMLIQ